MKLKKVSIPENALFNYLDSKLSGNEVACIEPLVSTRQHRFNFTYVSCLADVIDIYAGMDGKNGFEVFEDSQTIVVRVYGGSFSKNGIWETVNENIVITKKEYRYY